MCGGSPSYPAPTPPPVTPVDRGPSPVAIAAGSAPGVLGAPGRAAAAGTAQQGLGDTSSSNKVTSKTLLGQ